METYDDDDICYSTLLDHLPIDKDLFLVINFFHLASSGYTLVDSPSGSSCSLNWDSVDARSVLYLCMLFLAHFLIKYLCSCINLQFSYLFQRCLGKLLTSKEEPQGRES